MMIHNVKDIFHDLRSTLNIRFDGISVIIGIIEDILQINHGITELEEDQMRIVKSECWYLLGGHR